MARRKWAWTDHNLDKLNQVKIILNELNDYKPLTLRQVYYQLVGKGIIDNNKSQYTMLSILMKWARLDGYVSWDDIEDRGRVFHDLTGWGDGEQFKKEHIKVFLEGYKRDLLQSQDLFLEIWIEKDALSSVFTRAAAPYTVPVVVCRGFSSISFLNDYKQRVITNNRRPVILYFGDFDPSGVEMMKAMKTTFKDEMDIDIECKRIALLKGDISKYKLPHDPTAIKAKDTRSKKHIEQYGNLAVELDALRPDVLEKKIRDAIESCIDMTNFQHEQNIQAVELAELSQKKKDIIELL